MRIASLTATAVLCQALLIVTYRTYQGEIYVYESNQQNERKSFLAARELAWKALKFNPYNGYALYLAGSNEILTDHYDLGDDLLHRSLRYIPHQTNVLRLMSQTYFQQKRYDDAVAAAERYFRMDPSPHTSTEEM